MVDKHIPAPDDELGASAIREVERLSKSATSVEYLSVSGASFPIVKVYKGPDKGYEILDVKPIADKWRSSPEFRKGTARAHTVEAFVNLVNRFQNVNSAVFADFLSSPSLTAVIDYHPVGDDIANARFGQHRVKYDFPLSPEWQEWTAQNDQRMSQEQFANWLEDHQPELASPLPEEVQVFEEVMLTTTAEPSQLANLSRNLTIHSHSAAGQAIVLQTGEGSVQFMEDIEAKVSGQTVKVPGGFILAIPLFVGGETRRIKVRLRFRKEGSKVFYTFKLWRAKEMMREALLDAAAEVGTVTTLPVYEGAPEVAG